MPGYHTRFLRGGGGGGGGGGGEFIDSSMKHVNVRGSGGIHPRKCLGNLASLELIIVQFVIQSNYKHNQHLSMMS